MAVRLASLVVAAAALLGTVSVLAAEPAIHIGSSLQLFTDSDLIERLQNVRLEMHHPVEQEVVFTFDAPWEGSQSGYITFLRDGARFRMYYRGGGDLTEEVTCMAESTDGIHWTRPSLGLYEFKGTKDNNIIFRGRERGYWECHNFTPFLDSSPSCKPEERYKAVALGRYPDESGETKKMLVALASPDGIHWKRMQEAPIITKGSFDSQNVAFWDSARKQYVCYSRAARDGKRSVARSTSNDFLHWSNPEWLDFGPTPLEHFYTNAIVEYFRQPGIYLGFPMRFVPERTVVGANAKKVDALSDAVLITSRDGLHWDRTFMEAFIRPGLNDDNWGSGHCNNTPCWGILPITDEIASIYWTQNYGTHEEAWSPSVGDIRRGTVRTDGFCSVNAPYPGGELVTKPLRFDGKELVINYSTSAVGSVRVEVQGADGKPINGFSLEDCPAIYGDEIARAVAWKNGSDVSHLMDRTVRLRFVMKDADLFSIQFR